MLNWRTRQDLQEAGGQPGPRGLLLHLPPQDEGLRSGVRPGRWVQQQQGPKVDTCTWHSTVWVTMSVTVTMRSHMPNCLSDIARALVRTRSTRPSIFLQSSVIIPCPLHPLLTFAILKVSIKKLRILENIAAPNRCVLLRAKSSGKYLLNVDIITCPSCRPVCCESWSDYPPSELFSWKSFLDWQDRTDQLFSTKPVRLYKSRVLRSLINSHDILFTEEAWGLT